MLGKKLEISNKSTNDDSDKEHNPYDENEKQNEKKFSRKSKKKIHLSLQKKTFFLYKYYIYYTK